MYMFRRTVAVLVLALLLTCFAIPMSQPVSAAVSPDGWATQTGGTIWTLRGVWGTSSSDVYACGDHGTVLHYDGSSWTWMPTGITNVLFDVWGSSSDNVFAVGQNGVVCHYDGNSWSVMSSNTTTHLHGVWGSSPSDVFAVGNGGTIIHYDGNSWSLMENSDTSHLQDIWGSDANSVFAVGNGGTIISYNGTSWSQMEAGNPPNFQGVWGTSSSDVYAVGNSGTILSYNGTSWNPMTSGIGDNLYGVWGSSSNDLFVVGPLGMILHYDGDDWNLMNSGVVNDLEDVWGSEPLDVFAVGVGGTILHYWEPGPSITSVSPNQGNQGETLAVAIEGGNYNAPISVDFGAGITVDNVCVLSSELVAANITIADDAAAGTRNVTVTTADGTSEPYAGFTIPDAQLIDIDPPSGNQGETLTATISGTNLGATEEVNFGLGIAVNSFTKSPTYVTANITVGSTAVPGFRDVSVTANGTTRILEDGFLVPSGNITGLSPASGNQGQTLNVVISGTNLGGTTAATFGSGITVNGFDVSPTQVAANITISTSAAPGSREVSLTVDGIPQTVPELFVIPAGTITEMSPVSGDQGETLDVTIYGTNLGETTAVDFGSGITVNEPPDVTPTQVIANITVDSDATPGYRDISVTANETTRILEDGFLVPSGNITGLSPAFGDQGETLNVVISGTNLGGTTAVTFGPGITVNGFDVSPTQVTANITVSTSAAPGSREVSLTVDGTTQTVPNEFVIPPGTITEMSPVSGDQGQTLEVVISGTNLGGTTAVGFGTDITVNTLDVTPTQVVVNITIGSATAAGVRDVSVLCADGTTILYDGGFMVTTPPAPPPQAPTLTGIGPESGYQGSTLEVTLTGTNLDGVTGADFGAGITVGEINVESSTQITVAITIDAAASAGARIVTITTAGGTASLEENFRVAVPPPTLGGIDVISGRQGETLDVVLTGTDLDKVVDVSFGEGITVNGIQVDSPNQITVNITIDKDAEAGPRNVSVTTPGGTESLPDGFSVKEAGNSASLWWWLGLALVLLLLGLLFFMLTRKKKKRPTQTLGRV